uniref:Family with sequence similarity 180 member B n=1 Tax=Anabas testudineus TaxID=64144 RepID=A0A3Q1I4U7_ANATE
KYFCQLCITANWPLVPFSKVEKCMVFSLTCLCLDSQKWARESGGKKDLLLGGVEINQDNNVLLLDQEIASMKLGQAFFSQINDNIPKSQRSMEQMVTTLEDQRRPLTQTQFETLVLSMVYSAHQAWRQEKREDQEAWGGVLLQLVNVTVHDLRGSPLFSST